jgi:hypothetical protein
LQFVVVDNVFNIHVMLYFPPISFTFLDYSQQPKLAAGGTLHSVVMLHQQSEAQDLSRIHRNRAFFADMWEWFFLVMNLPAGGKSTLGWYFNRDPSPEDEHTSCVPKQDAAVSSTYSWCVLLPETESSAFLVSALSALSAFVVHV